MSEGAPPNPHEKLLTASLLFAVLAVLLAVLVWIWPSTFFLFAPESTPQEDVMSHGLNEADKDQVRLAMMERLREYQNTGIEEDERETIRQQLLQMQASNASVLSEVEKEQIRAQLRTP